MTSYTHYPMDHHPNIDRSRLLCVIATLPSPKSDEVITRKLPVKRMELYASPEMGYAGQTISKPRWEDMMDGWSWQPVYRPEAAQGLHTLVLTSEELDAVVLGLSNTVSDYEGVEAWQQECRTAHDLRARIKSAFPHAGEQDEVGEPEDDTCRDYTPTLEGQAGTCLTCKVARELHP